MKVVKLTKSELQEKLILAKKRALRDFDKKWRNYKLAEIFLNDIYQFKKYLGEIDDSKSFNVISMFELYLKKKTGVILFGSDSIVLLQENNDLYIYTVAKYKLK